MVSVDTQKVTIVGGGTAGMVCALLLKKKLPSYDIYVIESEKIGIIGVGEGSTEHWKIFCNETEISIDELILETKATHKYGIRFEGWSNKHPDYFHSISANESIDGSIPIYEYLYTQDRLFTNTLSHPSFIENKVIATENPHLNPNQYHFDTFKLNVYLHKLCKRAGIKVFNDEVKDIHVNPVNGFIEKLIGEKSEYKSDFWVDASGFAKVLISRMDSKSNWFSYSDYLLTDSAIPFPTPLDKSGEIRPYTRAIAQDSGWIWEIPTQERRGNGYVFSSAHCSQEQAVEAIKKTTGFELETWRHIKFDPGYLKKQWIKNCVAVGLASSFVEPLEATSISTAIQQSRLIARFLSSDWESSNVVQNSYNKLMDQFHDNLVSMIALHYVSDRRDTAFWRDMASMKKPPLLESMLEIWKYQQPSRSDYPFSEYELFGLAHFWHVAQGQGVVSKEACLRHLQDAGLMDYAAAKITEYRQSYASARTIYHHELFQKQA